MKQSENLPCRRCGEMLPPSEFYPHKGTSRGRQYVCKQCNTVAVRETAYRREIRDGGTKAFREKIRRQEAIVDLMRKTLAEYEAKD